MLSFVLRTAKPFRQTKSLIILYCSLVRSLVEYCSSVWSPIYKTHIDRIEAIQRRFVRALCSKLGLRRKILEYVDRLQKFSLATLERRRWMSDLCTLHKIVQCSIDAQLIEHLDIKIPTRSVRVPQLFSIPSTNNNVSQNNPLHRMCKSYNAICSHVDIFHDKLNAFKTFLLRHNVT